MNAIDFKTSGYFSPTINFVGGLLGILGAAVTTTSPLAGIIMLLLGFIVVTTHYRLSINFDKKIYHDYVWILGFKSGDKCNFENIEYLFIKKNRVRQTMNLRVASSTIRKEVYDGYLKFSEDNKLHLLTKDSKNDLIKKLRSISTTLKVKIIDYSEGEPSEV